MILHQAVDRLFRYLKRRRTGLTKRKQFISEFKFARITRDKSSCRNSSSSPCPSYDPKISKTLRGPTNRNMDPKRDVVADRDNVIKVIPALLFLRPLARKSNNFWSYGIVIRVRQGWRQILLQEDTNIGFCLDCYSVEIAHQVKNLSQKHL